MALVLEKSALAGLQLKWRDASEQGYDSGSILLYDLEGDCFIVRSEHDGQDRAIQFKQFTVEQDGGQLVLRVPTCIHKPLPELVQDPRYACSGDLEHQESGQHSKNSGSSSATPPQASQQLSAVLSQQLSGLIGRCFSYTEDGFEVAGPVQHQQEHMQQAADGTSDTAGPILPGPASQRQQGLQVQVHRRSRHSTDSTLDDGSFWGSPVKHDSNAAHGAATSHAAAGTAVSCSSAGTVMQQQLQQAPAASSIPIPKVDEQPPESSSTPPSAAAAGVQGASFTSFQEISRMISHSEDSSHLARPSSIKTTMAPGLAARFLDEQGSWGTPQENSPWGTPREQQLGSNATNTPTSGNIEQSGQQQQHAHHHSGYAVHKLVFGGEQLHSRLETAVPRQQHEEAQWGSSPAAGPVAPPADVLGACKVPAAKPAAPTAAVEGQPASGLEPAAVVAAAVAAVDAAAGAEADSFTDMDFTIPVAMDVQPRPHSRGSSRIREMYRVGSASTNTGIMVVDIPQPLSSRHAGLLRSPGRSLPAPSDPGSHSAAASAFSNAAGVSAAQASASAGGAAGLAEQRWTTSHIGVGLGSLGGSHATSHAASRRMSRNASSRLNVDQDWALMGPDGQLLQQQLAAMQAPQQRTSLGQVLHGPGVVSRRTSRTLSGRLAFDQDAAAVLMEQLDDAEPDVLSRPLAPAAPGLDTIISRRQSTSNGRGTPDSDGFGFSEFEGLEPLVPPEEAAAAALTEAAAAAAAAVTEVEGVSSGTLSAAGHHHHRAHRRSARNIGMPATSVSQRPSMRLSDQDPGHHGLAALPAMTAAAVAAAAAARAHATAAGSVPAPRTGSYDVIGGLADPQQQVVGEGQARAVGEDSGAAPEGGSGDASAALSRADSRSTGAAAGGSPRQSGTGASTTRSVSGSLQDNSRRGSKRSIPSIFQAAAAVAAAAEAAAAAAVGYALGGRERTSNEQQALQSTEGAPASAGEAAAAVQPTGLADAEQLPESAFASSSFLKQRLAGDGLGSVDSFTCPPFMPLAGSITVTGSRSGLCAASNNSSAVSSSNGSQPGVPATAGDSTPPAAAADMLPLAAATAVSEGVPIPQASSTGAAAAADGEPQGLYGSPAANIGGFTAMSGSPNAVTAALLRRQQLMSSEGSEWGSGALLGSHLHLSTSGIDSPTGSAVFRLGGNSPHPLDTCDSAGGSMSVAPGELSAALESLAVQSGSGTGGQKPVAGIGASRMAREAAAAAAAAGGCNITAAPVGAAALLMGMQVAAGLSKASVPGLSEITPAEDDDYDPDETRIAAKYPSDCGGNPAAGAVFFSLAGGVAPGEQTAASNQQLDRQLLPKRSSSGGGGNAAVRKVLGKVLSGKAAPLVRLGEQANSNHNTTSSSNQSRTKGFEDSDAAAAATRVSNDSNHSSSSSSSSDATPASYEEFVVAQADDEVSPLAGSAAATANRRVWSAQWPGGSNAAEGAAAASAAVSSVHAEASPSIGSIRQSAALRTLQSTATGIGSGPTDQQQQQQQQGGDSDGSIQPSTGLTRRTPHASRTPSQSLPAGMRPVELGLAGGRSFHYGDESDQPLMRAIAASTAGQEPDLLLEARSQVGRVVLHTFLALSAQWYDSLALVVLGPQLTGAMLPPHMTSLQQSRQLFGIFALGHVLWLLGCFLWPWKAAKLEQKVLLAWTLGLSGFCTALAGCVPSWSEGGMAGMVVITVARFCAGVALDNTAPAGLAYLAEHAPQCPSLHASLVPASMAAGAFGASGLALLLSWLMRPAVLAASGWRVVLALSLLSNAATAALRAFVLQQPESNMQAAELMDRTNLHVAHILRQYFPEVVLAVLLQAFAASGLFLLTAWLPSYFMQLAGMASSTALLAHTINMAVLAGSMPLGGLLADEWESTPVLLATCVTAVAFGYPAWLLLSMGVAEVTWLAQCILCIVVGLHWGALSEPLVSLFPHTMRSSALTVAHVVPMVALGATAPLMAVGFISNTGSPAAPAFINIIMAAVTACVVLWLNFKRRAGVRV